MLSRSVASKLQYLAWTWIFIIPQIFRVNFFYYFDAQILLCVTATKILISNVEENCFQLRAFQRREFWPGRWTEYTTARRYNEVTNLPYARSKHTPASHCYIFYSVRFSAMQPGSRIIDERVKNTRGTCTDSRILVLTISKRLRFRGIKRDTMLRLQSFVVGYKKGRKKSTLIGYHAKHVSWIAY